MRYLRLKIRTQYVKSWPCKKVKAFTLVELTVAMLISGLVVLAAFQLIGNFSNLYTTTQKNNSHLTQIHQFHKAMNYDMQQALSIQHYDDETTFHLPEEVSVSYQWEDECMVRSNGEIADTFFVKLNGWHLINDKTTHLPTVLELEIENDDHESELHRIVKDYDNEELFNITELKANR